MSWFRLNKRFTLIFFFFFQHGSSLELRVHNRAHNLFCFTLFVLNLMKGLMLNKLKIQDCLWNKSFLICNVFVCSKIHFINRRWFTSGLNMVPGGITENMLCDIIFFFFFLLLLGLKLIFFVSWSRQRQLVARLQRVCGLVTAPQVESLLSCTVENNLVQLVKRSRTACRTFRWGSWLNSYLVTFQYRCRTFVSFFSFFCVL